MSQPARDTVLPVHPALEQLRHLQELERQAAALRTTLDAVGQRRLDIEAPVAEAEGALQALTGTIEDRQTRRRAGDRDVAALQQRLTKYRTQLMAVTNAREYEAVQHEIATVEGELKAREDETITLLFELDELGPQAEQAAKARADQRALADEALAGLSDDVGHHERDLAVLEDSIVATRAAIDAATLAVYDRAARRYPRHAVAELKGELCTGCNVKLRPMLASDVRRGEKITQCENCTRLLYAVKPPPAAPPAAPSA